MKESLSGKKVAILATDGFEQSELMEPKKALEGAGATTHVIAPKSGEIRGWHNHEWGSKIRVDHTLDQCKASEYDALMIPGGTMSPDHLRTDPKAVQLVRDFDKAGKPIAAICHGPALLIEAGIVKGRRVTSWPSLRTDLTNAGANWVDQMVAADHGLITSRKPADIPDFSKALIDQLAEGHQQQRWKEAS
ncbi:MAG TPA: type 1 glutamine amidotransferase domain-containing protein [Acidobacteriaceae bacterium]|nr:type 1 glutamine amidotransferase domain-containing protein [Acidobacteriaceae bacterium]